MSNQRSRAAVSDKRPTILISSNTAWSVFNFREGLIRELITRGFDVAVIAPKDEFSERLVELGCDFTHQSMDNRGTNPIKDFALFLSFVRTYLRLRPAVVINFTIKPVIYGGLAASVLKIPYISVITGLGSVFVDNSWVTGVVERLYRITQTKAATVFFLNRDDLAIFAARNLLGARSRRKLVPGSGVNTEHYSVEVLPSEGVNVGYFLPSEERELPRDYRIFLLSARMIHEKGVGVFVDAARIVKRRFPKTKFQLLGPLGVLNRSAVSSSEMESWVSEGIVDYLGNTSDVRPYIRVCDCVVLPSYYREGVPRSLLESAAMGKPIITTDNVGCRDVVDVGINGFLCEPRSVESLAQAMFRFLELPNEQIEKMGIEGRAKILREFDEKLVISMYIEALSNSLMTR